MALWVHGLMSNDIRLYFSGETLIRQINIYLSALDNTARKRYDNTRLTKSKNKINNLKLRLTFCAINLNKSAYITKQGQRYGKTLNNLSLHVLNHVLKEMFMLNYETINNTNSLYYSFIEVLIDFINSVIAIHVFINNSIFYFSLVLLMIA